MHLNIVVILYQFTKTLLLFVYMRRVVAVVHLCLLVFLTPDHCCTKSISMIFGVRKKNLFFSQILWILWFVL